MEKNKIKVGTITFHCSYNYGSALQAYALQEYLKSNGFDIKIIDFVMKNDFEQYKLFRTKVYKKNIKAILADIILLRKNIKRKYSFEQFTNKYFIKTLNTYYSNQELCELNKELDAFICGSDQIWNLDCTKGIEPAYFLEFVDNNKIKIAYGPSVAHTELEEFDKDRLKVLLERFDYISVREKSTIANLKQITDKPIVSVIDPTLLLESEDYMSILKPFCIKDEFIFFYILEPNIDMIEYCNRLARKSNLSILYLSRKRITSLKNAKNVYGIEPGEFLYLIKEAKYVVTNSFHATVFSILFNRQFATFTTKKSGSRMVDLLIQLGLENRIVEQAFNMEASIDYQSVLNKLNQLRQSSKRFLNQALGEEE